MICKSDIEIAQSIQMKPIMEIASSLDIPEEAIELYGNTKCKVDYRILDSLQHKPDGKLDSGYCHQPDTGR
jgi:formate--tetrahydrofolate ligase